MNTILEEGAAMNFEKIFWAEYIKTLPISFKEKIIQFERVIEDLTEKEKFDYIETHYLLGDESFYSSYQIHKILEANIPNYLFLFEKFRLEKSLDLNSSLTAFFGKKLTNKILNSKPEKAKKIYTKIVSFLKQKENSKK